VKRGFDWLSENLPGLMTNTLTAGWNTEFAHDQSKNEPDEYEAYDAYFYGNNRSYEVVQRYQRAWLLHIHRNPHHWQHWVLIHDDMEDGELETVLEMPYDYIIEMICDWWSFSWQSGNLYEIFKWYEEHSKYIKLAQTTKITVEYILDNMKKKLASTTILSLLTRLENKNFVEVTKQGKMNLYTPMVSQSDYQAHESQSVLEKLYGNSLKKFVTSLYHGKKISSEEVQDLSEFLKNLEDREE